MSKAGPVLLEPVSELVVTVPEANQGDIMGDLNGKRGRIQGSASIGGGEVEITANVPTSEILRYAIDLRSMTGGRGRSWPPLALRPGAGPPRREGERGRGSTLARAFPDLRRRRAATSLRDCARCTRRSRLRRPRRARRVRGCSAVRRRCRGGCATSGRLSSPRHASCADACPTGNPTVRLATASASVWSISQTANPRRSGRPRSRPSSTAAEHEARRCRDAMPGHDAAPARRTT